MTQVQSCTVIYKDLVKDRKDSITGEIKDSFISFHSSEKSPPNHFSYFSYSMAIEVP